ncbi:MAG: 3-hydroxyacyl-CoA dehydrogenase [Alphaproteobacteria bacterium]|nr:3-hydroxyacyl-CoA dehydrogenase [Alphaproteobacteria bacterium]
MAALPSSATVAVIGAGTMGAGIAQVAAQAGHPVLLHDTRAGAMARARDSITKSLARVVERGRMAEAEAAAVVARIQDAETVERMAGSALVVEAIVEDLAAKIALFRALEGVVAPDAILASNTSSLSITELAGALKHPGRVAGFHFFNPAPVMPLVEVVAGFASDPAVVECLMATAKAWSKEPVRCASTPGFLGNRIARPFYGEALRALEERTADVPTYDAILKEAAGFRMGPFELLDLVGIDVNWAVTNSVHDAYFHDPRFKPFRIQGEMVAAGLLGRKSGRGFYDHREGAAMPLPAEAPRGPAPAEVVIVGDLGPAAALEARFAKAGLSVRRMADPSAATADPATVAHRHGHIQLPGVRAALSDGRTATERMAAEGAPLVLFDLALDYGAAPRLALAKADQAPDGALAQACGLFQAAGIKASVIDDAPAMAALRTVAMLANLAADTVHAGIANAADADKAMRIGFNYPLGPLAWADRLGLPFLVRVLDNVARAYGEDRYRASPLLRRKAAAGLAFHG